MIARLVNNTATVVAASMIGVTTGLVSAFLLSLPASLLARGEFLGIPTVPMGALLGFVVGAGTAALGLRPHSGLSWSVVSAIGILLGAWAFNDYAHSADMLRGLNVSWLWASFVLCSIAAAVGWLVHLSNTRILTRRLPVGDMSVQVIIGYLVALAFTALVFPRLLRLLAFAFSY